MIDLLYIDGLLFLFGQPVMVYILVGIPTFITLVISLVLVLKKWGDYA